MLFWFGLLHLLARFVKPKKTQGNCVLLTTPGFFATLTFSQRGSRLWIASSRQNCTQ
jgi:hypothetical protein